MSDIIPIPKEWIGCFYNACTEPCDMLQGPCACGASHYLEEWTIRRKKLSNNGWIDSFKQLQAENEKLKAENNKYKEVLEIAYNAYRDKCTGKIYTVKQIAKVHRLCKQALKGGE